MSREYFRPGVLPPAPRRLDGRNTALLAAPPGTAQLALSQGSHSPCFTGMNRVRPH